MITIKEEYFTSLLQTLNRFFYTIPMKSWASCYEVLYACIIEICGQSIDPIFNHLLHFFITTHARAAQVCEQVEPGPWL
jgi:hypothetical protein